MGLGKKTVELETIQLIFFFVSYILNTRLDIVRGSKSLCNF